MEKPSTSLPTGDKKEDGEILADALNSVVSRINETYSRLSKLERQLNLHPRSAQEYSESLKQYDQMLPNLLAISHTSELSKSTQLQHQSNLLIGLWGATRQLVALSSTHKKPYEWGSFIAPVSNYITEISTVYEVEAPKSDESVGIQLHALSIASQAFKWGVSPITVIVDLKTVFTKEKLSGTIPDLVERMLNELLDYLENHHKCGIEWKGVREAPHLVWDTRSILGGNLANGSKTKPLSKDQWICEYLNKSLDYDCSEEQHCQVSYANQGALTITGKALSLSLSGCSYTTVTVREASHIEISNCKEVTVVCPKATEIAIERSVGIHVLTGPAVDLSTSCVSRLQVETQTEASDKDLVEVAIPTGIKIKVGKSGKITTTAVEKK